MNQSFYTQLKEILLKKHAPSEVDDMLEYLEEAARESGLPEEEYLASLGSVEEVASFFADTPQTNIESSETSCQEISAIKNLYLSIPNGTIEIRHGQTSNVNCTKGSEAINIRQEGDKLIIAAKPQKSFFKKRYPEIDLVVCLADTLKVCDLHTVNASLDISQIKAEEAKIESVNGSLNIGECKFEEAKISNVNGKICVRNAFLGKIKVETVNGKLALSACSVRKGKIDTVNGKIELNIHTNASIKISTVCAKIIADQMDPIENIGPASTITKRGTDPNDVLKISSVGGTIQFIS